MDSAYYFLAKNNPKENLSSMARIKKKHWLSIVLFLIAIILMAYNIFRIASGTRNITIEILAWIMMIVANLYMIWTIYQGVKAKNKSTK